ncbi:endo alpha-1,4 polygalactosaminidase [Brevibacterium spongiae]|uniref:Endo alpha-1,4 polygalactosaminidase n=1 Tax=Brevibacterium spongiae TaxID=2909672 RepID=A0ABY5SQB0_9MICO|nr:endo alpha-1,4 polygalactosaminidase [Brevibacterium spongiae]UVI36101.1 endo alpha-1,4 polygalactosaminidase [Brevibacterium spongiae]
MRPRVRRHPPRWMATAVIVGVAATMGGCAADASSSTPAEGTVHSRSESQSQPESQSRRLSDLSASSVFDYQLGGTYDSLPTGSGTSIDIVVRDAGAAPLTGAYSVCYVNGFQTQPDEADRWRDHEDLLLHDAAGNLVVDPEWPDEHILDPSTAAQRSRILDIIGPMIDGCADRGFDAVEIDNLDTADRFPDIDRAGAMELAAAYVDRAHGRGLAIAQKNAAELTRTAHDDLGFDFAVAEECAAFAECDRYTDVYGDRVLAVEYPDTLAEAGLSFTDACTDPDRPPLMILRDRDLVVPDATDYLFERC